MANETLMMMLDWEKSEAKAGAMSVDEVHEEKKGEGRASLVGTKTSLTPPPVFGDLIEIIRSLSKLPEGEEIRPIEVISIGRQLRLFTPEDVTRLAMDFEESIKRLAA
jgi:hypothetical protein